MIIKKHVHIIACGGTIAGRADTAAELIGYTAGAISIEDLLSSVPQVQAAARTTGEQFSNIDSSNMTEALWLKLAARTEALSRCDDVDGIVITHGTDTLEETAYFLNLMVHTDKPVILTGAMRPATAISPDGPLNLLEAVRLAACAEAGRYGVLVAMNGTICAARFVEKTDTTHIQAFISRQHGIVGLIQDGVPVFYQAPQRLHTYQSVFSCTPASVLPPVWILYGHVGMAAALVDCAVAAGVQGLVLAGLGCGKNPDYVGPALERAVKRGVIIVRASRVLGGMVSTATAEEGIICADTLTPQKAKILLQAALMQTRDQAAIEAFFSAY